MKVTRDLIREYYGITTGETTAYHYMNTGFIKLAEENSPQVDKTAFVGDTNSSATVVGYENKWTFEAQNISGNTVVDDLVEIAREQKTGTGCERTLISVDMAAAAVSGAYPARKCAIVVEATPPTGDPKAITKVTGTLHQNGDIILGTFNPTTSTWTAA